jgi:hypothetical protein
MKRTRRDFFRRSLGTGSAIALLGQNGYAAAQAVSAPVKLAGVPSSQILGQPEVRRRMDCSTLCFAPSTSTSTLVTIWCISVPGKANWSAPRYA